MKTDDDTPTSGPASTRLQQTWVVLRQRGVRPEHIVAATVTAGKLLKLLASSIECKQYAYCALLVYFPNVEPKLFAYAIGSKSPSVFDRSCKMQQQSLTWRRNVVTAIVRELEVVVIPPDIHKPAKDERPPVQQTKTYEYAKPQPAPERIKPPQERKPAPETKLPQPVAKPPQRRIGGSVPITRAMSARSSFTTSYLTKGEERQSLADMLRQAVANTPGATKIED